MPDSRRTGDQPYVLIVKFAVVFALLMLGCVACSSSWSDDAGYEGDPIENAIAAYEAMHRPLTEQCRDHALNVEIEYAALTAVEHQCECTDCGGCMDRYDAEGGHVWLMEDAPAYLVAHETLHVISACMQPTRAGDPNHSDPAWQDARIKP